MRALAVPGSGSAVVGPWLPPLLGLALATLLWLPVAGAQGCGQEPGPPSCTEPDVAVSRPANVSVPLDDLREGGLYGLSPRLQLPVNISYEAGASSPGQSSNVTVEPRPGSGLEVRGGTAAASPGQTVTVPVEVVVPPGARAGQHTVALSVNTSATDEHRPTNQTVETQVLVPWWVSGWSTKLPSFDPSSDRIDVTLRTEVTVNGPVDLLVTSDTNTVEPSLYEASEAWSPDGRLVAEWDLRLEGVEDGAFDWSLWPVLEAGDGLACIGQEQGTPIPLGGGSPPGGCLKIGGSSGSVAAHTGIRGTAVTVVMGLVLLSLAAATGLGVFVLRRGGSTAPPRALGTYLVLAGPAFGLLALHEVLVPLFGSGIADAVVPAWVAILVFATMALLPAAILTFAVSYPTLHPRLRGKGWWPAIPAGPSTLLAVYLLTSFIVARGSNPMPLHRGLPLFGTIATGGAVAALLFHRRSKIAATDLEDRRVGYMLRWVALPLTIAATALLGVYLVDEFGVWDAYGAGLLQVAFAALALLPVLGMAWGLLKYKVVDLEAKLELTVSRGFVASVFVSLFFVVSEAAGTFFSETIGPYVGLLAAGVLVLVLAPLERVGQRLASQVTRERPDPEDYRRFRRLEVYRATYEDVTVDDEVTRRERGTLDALAANLDLSEEEIAFVESEVAKERGSGGDRPPLS